MDIRFAFTTLVATYVIVSIVPPILQLIALIAVLKQSLSSEQLKYIAKICAAFSKVGPFNFLKALQRLCSQ